MDSNEARPQPPILAHSRVVAEGRTPERWLLVLHGIYGSGRNWGTVARRVVDARPEWGALLVDLRMHGGSQGFAPPHTLEATAADVDALVEHLDFHAAAVLGHSFGGKVALMYAREHAEGLRQAWVVDSTLEVREPSGSAWRIIDVVRSLPEEFASRDELVGALEEQGYPRPLGQWLAMNLERDTGGFRWRLDWDGIEEMLRDYFRTDLWEVVENPPAGAEVHVVKATESEALDAGDVTRIEAAGRTNGRTFLHRVEGGHWINTDNPDAVVRLLTDRLP
ncbi:MAG TPA: alpha/beta hydrolase [Longimicrobiaceae bacterium]|nr:alpha/beta hydrolase [Longimicrobiaceae bacterium]